MSIKKAYNNWSETYDLVKNYTRDLDEIVTQETLADLHFNSIIEIGCGTGKNTSLLSQISNTVHAIDFSEGIIKKAKEKISAGNVKFSVANITQKWPCEDQSVAFITCNLVLEHIEDLSFIFSEACRSLAKNGRFFISELHPFRQYQGKKAHFEKAGQLLEIQAFIHNISDFINAAKNNGFILNEMKEWWHQEEQNQPPRIVSFMFVKYT
jgi:malonyl-CoA O-methyltransferase